MTEETRLYLLGIYYIARTIRSHRFGCDAKKFAFERWMYENNMNDPFSCGVADGMLLAVGQ